MQMRFKQNLKRKRFDTSAGEADCELFDHKEVLLFLACAESAYRKRRYTYMPMRIEMNLQRLLVMRKEDLNLQADDDSGEPPSTNWSVTIASSTSRLDNNKSFEKIQSFERIQSLEREFAVLQNRYRIQKSRLDEANQEIETIRRENQLLRQANENLEQTVKELQRKLAEATTSPALPVKETSTIAEERLIATEKIDGQVIQVSENEVVIEFDPSDSDQDVFIEAYEASKFNLGHTPKVGECVVFDIKIQLAPVTESSENSRNSDDDPRPQRTAITGDHWFESANLD